MPGILFFVNFTGKSYNDIEDISPIGDIRKLATAEENPLQPDRLNVKFKT